MKSFSSFILFAVFSLAFLPAFAQEKPKANSQLSDSTVVLELAEVSPEFPGGIEPLMKFLFSKIQNTDMANKPEGVVILQFVVTETGKIENIMVLRSLEPTLDSTAIKAVEAMPNWIPGTNKGQAAKVYYYLPVRFSKNISSNSKSKTKEKNKK